jgi:hypothetical protein
VADLRVELLVVEDCPHLEQARHDLESVLGHGVIEVPIQLVYVTSTDDAEFLGFQGSPTVRINGDDVDPHPDLPIGLGCRLYRTADGRVVGSPPIDLIKAAVDTHRRGRLQAFQRDEAAKVAEFARAAAESEVAAADRSNSTDAAVTSELAPKPGASESSTEPVAMKPEGRTHGAG